MKVVIFSPAALRLDQAAKYCGLSIPTFMRVCPVQPMNLADGRWLAKRLDEWMYNLPDGWTAESDANNFASSEKQPGWVYVVGFLNYVKIGFTSKSIEERMVGLQTGCPERITIYSTFRGSKQYEDYFHKRFAAYNTQGEWFRREGNLSAWIDGGCK